MHKKIFQIFKTKCTQHIVNRVNRTKLIVQNHLQSPTNTKFDFKKIINIGH